MYAHQEACPFCAQEESINHILLDCVLAREVCTSVYLALNKPDWVPPWGSRLVEWCTNKFGADLSKKDVRVIFLLVMWKLCKHHNAIVFDGTSPSLSHVVHIIEVEGRTWKQALKGDVEALFGALVRWASVRN